MPFSPPSTLGSVLAIVVCDLFAAELSNDLKTVCNHPLEVTWIKWLKGCCSEKNLSLFTNDLSGAWRTERASDNVTRWLDEVILLFAINQLATKQTIFKVQLVVCVTQIASMTCYTFPCRTKQVCFAGVGSRPRDYCLDLSYIIATKSCSIGNKLNWE